MVGMSEHPYHRRDAVAAECQAESITAQYHGRQVLDLKRLWGQDAMTQGRKARKICLWVETKWEGRQVCLLSMIVVEASAVGCM